MDKMTEAQKVAYLEAHAVMQQQMIQHAATLQQQQQAAAAAAAAQVAVHQAHQQQQSQAAAQQSKVKMEYVTTLKVPVVPQPGSQAGTTAQQEHTFTIADDGTLGYDDGVRVLRSIGTWSVLSLLLPLNYSLTLVLKSA